MTRKSKNAYQINPQDPPRGKLKKPFWLSSVNYYILTSGISIACFFITWGVLLEFKDEVPWITSGIVAGLILIISVMLREFVFKTFYQKSLQQQKRLDNNLKSFHTNLNHQNNPNRLTLERNAAFVAEIEEKSKKAISIGKLSSLHFEVFEMCNEYIRKSNRELDGLYKSSPRYIALRQGQTRLQNLHHFHLLSWASIESQHFIQTAKLQVSISDKIENAQRALDVIETATRFYPNDGNLLQSTEAIKDFIGSIKVEHLMEQGEMAAFKEQFQIAIDYFRDALFFLEKDGGQSGNSEILERQIHIKIEELKNKIIKIPK